MAHNEKIANRYARAIFDYLGKADKIAAVAEDLKVFGGVLAENRELARVLSSEVTARQSRLEIVTDVAKTLKLSESTLRVLTTLSDQRRVDIVAVIAERLRIRLLESSDVVPLHVEVQEALDDNDKEKLESRFKKILGKKVDATYVVEPTLIGGLRVTAAGRTFDGSLVGWLTTFEEKLGGSI